MRKGSMNNEDLRRKLGSKFGVIWIGVDLDGTLAVLDENTGSGVIGRPVWRMLTRVKRMVAAGEKVKIFTARAGTPEEIPVIRNWLKDNGLPPNLEITNRKDYAMLEYWDDSCVLVERNTGRILAKNK